VSRAQLRAIGLSADAIDGRLERGSLHPIHRAVYAVGHTRITRDGHYTAAVLAWLNSGIPPNLRALLA
jgi:hypothetical protein